MQSEADTSKSGISGGSPTTGRGRAEPGPGVGDEVTPDRPRAGRGAEKLDTGGGLGVGDDRTDPVESLEPMGGLGTGTTETNTGMGGASGRMSDGAGSVAEAGGTAQDDGPLADPAGPSEGTGGDTPYRPSDRPV